MDYYSASDTESMLAVDEGKKFSPYVDTRGHPTVGIGHNLDAAPIPAGWAYPLTEAQVDELFQRDIAKTIANLDARLPWWRASPAANILVDMGFNMGVGQWGVSGLLSFTTSLGLIKGGQFKDAADHLAASLWDKQVGSRADRIEAKLRAM